MRFEWDEGKNRVNRAKHGIDFNFASLAFDDIPMPSPLRIAI